MDTSKIKYLHDGDKWILAEDIPDIDFQFSQIWLSSFVNNLEKTIGTNYRKVLSVYDGYNLKFYYGDKDSERVSEVILQKILEENLAASININIRQVADKLYEVVDPISEEYLKDLDNAGLADLYKKLDDIHTEFYVWSWLPNAVDMFHAHLTNHLKELLAQHLKTLEEVNAALVALSFSEEKSFVQEEAESLLRIALYKKTHPEDNKEFDKMLKNHHARYFFLKHQWIAKEGVSTLEEYKSAALSILVEKDPKIALEKEEEVWAESKKARDSYESTLGLTDKEKQLFRQYAEFAFTKAYRRRIQLYWAYKMDFIFHEVAERLGITFMEARYLLPEEAIQSLQAGMTEDLRKEVAERIKHCVYYAEKGVEIVATGQDCRMFEETIVTDVDTSVTEFAGQVACVGKVRGPVKIVNTPADISKVNQGDVLVSIATNPDILPAMQKAVAFVTEQGGITSHAAIVAREMKKPCIIGTKIATKVLKDGDMIEVDAEKGIVRKI